MLIARFEPIPVLEAIQRHRCTIFLGAPPMFVAWVNTPSLGDYDLSSLRIVNSGAAALPVEVLRALPRDDRRRDQGGLRPDRDGAGDAQQYRGAACRAGDDRLDDPRRGGARGRRERQRRADRGRRAR